MKKVTYLLTMVVLMTAMVSAQWKTAMPGYAIGDKAEDFRLKNVDGKMVSLADYKDAKGYIVIFTCNNCPYAQMYEQRIIDLHNTYAPQGYPVIAVNPNDPDVVPADSYTEMQKRAKTKKYPFAYVFDEGQTVYPKFGATRTPHVFILDKDRTIKYIGGIDDNPEDGASAQHHFATDALEALKKGQDPNPSMTKALGCSIKKKS